MVTDYSRRFTGFSLCRKASVLLAVMVVLSLWGTGELRADQGLFPMLGGQRAGTSSMTFLKIPVGARAEAMGGAYVAVANDHFAVFWNPAGIAQVGNRWRGKYVVDPLRPPRGVKAPPSSTEQLFNGDRALGMVHINWLAEISYDAVSYIHPLPSGVLGFSAASLSTADMEITTEYHPDGTGEYFSYGDALVGLSYALAMTDNFSWGVTLKYARETLADTHMDNVMIDLGTYYWTGFRDLRIGVALVHFGPNSRPEGGYRYYDDTGMPVMNDSGEPDEKSYKPYAPPTEFRLGGAMTVFARGHHRFLAAVQLNHPVDNSENLKLGAEYGFMNMLFARGGVKLNTDEDHWTCGGGVRAPWNGMAVCVDYSYTDFGILEKTQRISLGITF